MSDIELFKRKFERERLAKMEAERLLEEKSTELYHSYNQVQNLFQSIERKEARLRAILESAVDSIVRTDQHGHIISFNASAALALGYEKDRLPGLTIAKILPDLANYKFKDDRELDLCGFKEKLISEVNESNALTSVGESIPIEYSLSKIIIQEEVEFIWIIRDISLRKVAEAKLKEANQKLLDLSRSSGIAEIATSLLHNIGNVLNSVHTSNALIKEKLTSSRLSGLGKAVELLRQEVEEKNLNQNSDKLEPLVAYLEKLDLALASEKEEILEEFGTAIKDAAHIEEIVKSQQKYAGDQGLKEEVYLPDLITDAISMNRSSFDNYNIQIEQDYVELKPIWADKHKIMQIIVNLIRNAKDAIIEHAPEQPKLRIGIDQPTPGTISVSVKDNGMGITSETREKLFSYGFTTKKDGHGFGLHSCSLAAKNLDGSLEVESEGLGQGATFSLSLPYSVQEESYA